MERRDGTERRLGQAPEAAPLRASRRGPRAARPAGGGLAAFLLVASLEACGASQADPVAIAARDAVTIQSKLVAGHWRLSDYRPDVALEPMLQILLSQQVRSMIVSFDGRALHAQSPTVRIDRGYVVENAAAFRFDLVSPDFQGGGTLQSRCEMSEDGRRLQFHAQTEPWTGTGTLDREGP